MSADAVLLQDGASAFEDAVAHLDTALPIDLPTIHAEVRRRFDALLDGVAGGGRGMLLVKGDPGQGKTHVLAWFRRHADARALIVDIPPLKDASGLFAHLLRYTAAGLQARGALRPLVWQALLRATVELRAQALAAGDDETRADLDEVLPGHEQFRHAFRLLLQSSRAARHVLEGARRVAPLVALDPDTARVLSRLADAELEPLVYDWIIGADLSDAELARLGLRAPLSGEAQAFSTLEALVRLSDRPLVLCFDQLETVTGLLGPAAMATLFSGLMELYQQAPVGIVLMCQTSVWGELRAGLPQAALERVTELPPLPLPTVDEARQIIEARLGRLWRRHGVTPPYPSYPFSPAWIDGYCRAVRPTLRRVILDCSAALDRMRQKGRVETSPVGAPAPELDERSIDDLLSRSFANLLSEVRAGRLCTTPEERQDRLRSALSQLAAALANVESDGVQVLDLDAPAKPKAGPRPPAVIHVTASSGLRRRLAFDVNGERSAYHTFERVRARVLRGEADAGVVFREARLELGEGARRTLEIARSLEPLGGLAYLDEATSDALLGCDLLLDAVAGHDLALGGRAVERREALAHLLAHAHLAAPLANVFERALRVYRS